MDFLEWDYLVVYYYLCASEIWPDKRSDLWLEGPYKRGTISVHLISDLIRGVAFDERDLITEGLLYY
jgi:hypothetical protein